MTSSFSKEKVEGNEVQVPQMSTLARAAWDSGGGADAGCSRPLDLLPEDSSVVVVISNRYVEFPHWALSYLCRAASLSNITPNTRTHAGAHTLNSH